MARKQKTQSLECLTIGDLLVRDSSLNQDQFHSAKKLDSQKLKASKFFGKKSAKSVRPQTKVKRNYRHEAELLIIDHYNGIENNYGFTKAKIGGRTS